MEQLVILVLIGLISLINWMVQKSGEARARRKTELQESEGEFPTAPEELRPVATRNEARESGGGDGMRQLLEALGVETFPASPSSPALPTEKEPSPPEIPSHRSSLVEMNDRFASHSLREDEMHKLPRVQRKAPVKQRPKLPERKMRTRPKRIGSLLTAPGGLRQGILLSEILGPPKAFRHD